MTDIEIRVAAAADLPVIAEFRWVEDCEPRQPVINHDRFVADFVEWVSGHSEQNCVMAIDRASGDRMVGMAWLAVLPRVPRALNFDRAGGDVQSVYVLPDYRGAGVGADILQRLVELARELGLTRVTVQSSRRAIPLYKRTGFALREYLRALELG